MSNTSVVVGCKLPNGLVLELGSRGSPNYKTVTIKGANSALVVGGYGLTDVDGEFMAAWLKKHAWLPAVRNGAIFLQSDMANASAQASDTSQLVTGLERLDPKNAPKGIEVDKEHMQQSTRDVQQAMRA